MLAEPDALSPVDCYYESILDMNTYEPVYGKSGLMTWRHFSDKEHYDVTTVYLSICTKSKSFEQWKILKNNIIFKT